MMQILLGIALTAIGIMFMTYGVWTGYELTRQTNIRRQVADQIEIIATHVRAVREQLGRVPQPSELDSGMPDKFSTGEITFTYTVNGSGVGEICAYASGAMAWRNNAFQRMATDTGGIYGPDCGVAGVATSSRVAITVQVN